MKEEKSQGSFLSQWRWEWLVIFGALLSDVNSWGHQFVLDDQTFIFKRWLLESRPFTQFTLLLNLWVAGPHPDAFHVVNRILHICICLLVFWVIRKLIPQPTLVAPLTALIFAVHPIQVEAVTYIQGRADELAMFFFMISWLLYLRTRENPAHKQWVFAGSLIGYALGLLSKENAITLLGVLLLTEFVFFANGQLKKFFEAMKTSAGRLYLGYIGVTVLYLIQRYMVYQSAFKTGGGAAENPLTRVSYLARELTALKVLFQSTGLFFWPISFSPDYSYNQIPAITRWTSSASLIVLGLTFITVVFLAWAYLRLPNIFFGFAFYLVTVSIVSNLVIDIGTIRADRFLYMPGMGLCLIVAIALSHLWNRIRTSSGKKILGAAICSLLILLWTRTIIRNRDWKDDLTLYEHAARTSPNSIKVRTHLGWLYYSRNELGKAYEQYKAGESIDPKYPELLADMGALFLQQGDLNKAISYFERGLAVPSSYESLLHIDLGSAFRKQGNLAGAIHQFDLALEVSPGNANAHFNKGNALYAEGRIDDAIAEYSKALESDPQMTVARDNLEFLMKKKESQK